ncbi:glycosyl hydrolase family 28-related protein [Pseudopedobacter beijingensis]|uniref:Glycosyl hydrolase family 28-related protein n=1 Tax=Pseudopedobacter beijingensis TaxID=1207056 RepID=A0ABW4II42_9SPHI
MNRLQFLASTVLGFFNPPKKQEPEIKYMKRVNDTLIELLDSHTNEYVTFSKVTKYADGSAMNDAKCDGVIYRKLGSEYFKRNFTGPVNVKWFGAKGDGVTDDSLAVQNASKYGGELYFTAGTYVFNASFNQKIVICGEGSERTILKPFDITKAIITYTSKGPYWTYHSEIRNVSFASENKTGVGFAFSKTNFSDYEIGDEYSNNVKFYGCRFLGLEKGVQFTYGNIGTEFYSCGWTLCKYGVYCVSNKFGAIMHAGNKYFYGGQIDSCDVGVYIHNTAIGFGGFSITDTILEYNKINFYCYSTNTYAGPVSFMNIWNEGSGSVAFTDPVSIDNWDGNLRTQVNVLPRSFMFEGYNSNYTFYGGTISDILVTALNSQVLINGSQAERYSGVGAAPSDVDITSEIIFENCVSYAGFPIGNNITLINPNTSLKDINGNVRSSIARGLVIKNRLISQSLNYPKISKPLNVVTNLGAGSFNSNGTLVSDGILNDLCNEYLVDFSNSSQLLRLLGSEITVNVNEWIVMTCGVKLISGSLNIKFWNRSSLKAAEIEMPKTFNKWFTVGFLGKVTENGDIYMDFSSPSENIFRLSNFQAVKFGTESEAKEFLNSNIFIV